MLEHLDGQLQRYPEGIPFKDLFPNETEWTPPPDHPSASEKIEPPGSSLVVVVAQVVPSDSSPDGNELLYDYLLISPSKKDNLKAELEKARAPGDLVFMGYDTHGHEPGSAHETIPVFVPRSQFEYISKQYQIF